MFKTVIFDLDGTILNTLEDLANAGNYVCRQNGWPEHSLEEFRQFVGHGIPNLIEKVAPDFAHSPLIVATAIQQFCSYYAAHGTDCTYPYSGILELLARLKEQGIVMGVYSNKQHNLCKDLVNHYFPDTFTYVQGKESGVALKPNLEGTQRVLSALDAQVDATLFVGDSMVDIQTAQNAGLQSCAVSWGFRDVAQLQERKPTYLVDTAQAIGDIVLG